MCSDNAYSFLLCFALTRRVLSFTDCNDDNDCDFGLRCFERDGEEEVPGCFGVGEWGEDYCYYAGNGLGQCEGGMFRRCYLDTLH